MSHRTKAKQPVPVTMLASCILLLSLVASVIAAGVLLPYLDSGQKLVKVRNAAIFEPVDVEAFRWAPESVPDTFIREEIQPPATFRSIAASITAPEGSELSKALRIAEHLASAPERSGVAIQADMRRTYNEIVERGEGYCADYTMVFTGLAHAAGIPVREWGMSFDGFGGDGHAFTEIWDRGLRKWVLVDSFYSFYVTDRGGQAVSVLELRQYLGNGGTSSLNVVPIDAEQFMFPSFEFALEYYRRGLEQAFMIWGDNVFTYDTHWAIRAAGGISRAAEQLTGISLGLQPRIMILATSSNRPAVDELRRLRSYVWLGIASGVGALAAMVVLIVTGLVRARRRAS